MSERGHRGLTLRVVTLTVVALALAIGSVARLAADDARPRQPVLERVLPAADRLYAGTRRSGVLISFDGGLSWHPRRAGLPRRAVYPFPEQPDYELITGLGIDPTDPDRIAATTASAVFRSDDAGTTWRQIPTADPIGRNSYFTAAAPAIDNPQGLLLGTSFDGLYETADDGASWATLSRHIGYLWRGAGFYEEIAAVTYDPRTAGAIGLMTGFDGLVYLTTDRASWQQLQPPTGDGRALSLVAAGDGQSGTSWRVQVSDQQTSWLRTAGDAGWEAQPLPAPVVAAAVPADVAAPPAVAAGRSGIYVSARTARARFDQALELLDRHGMNSFVVDLKDDFGHLTYDSKLALPREIGAVRPGIDLDQLVARAHAAGQYVIGRLVVFKDEQLYGWQSNRFAVWDGQRDAPWRHLVPVEREVEGETQVTNEQREYWVDPFAPEVWEYNVAIAEELAARGVDEIQFDYIRFPSDGPVHRARYRHRQAGMDRIDAIESFLALARERLDVPIGTDLFGFNAWHRMGNWIGQSIETLADYVDVISPMYYPSHFPRSFLGDVAYLDRAYTIYAAGVQRAKRLVSGRSHIRPYVQAFLIGGELEMERPEYGSYLTRQLDGVVDGAGSGFTLWNASNRYYMVTQSLLPYTRPETGADRPAAAADPAAAAATGAAAAAAAAGGDELRTTGATEPSPGTAESEASP